MRAPVRPITCQAADDDEAIVVCGRGEAENPYRLKPLPAQTPEALPRAAVSLGNGASARRGWLLAGVYVISMALVYAALGVVAALLGASMLTGEPMPRAIASLDIAAYAPQRFR